MGTRAQNEDRLAWLRNAVTINTTECVLWPWGLDPTTGYARITYEGEPNWYVHWLVLLFTGRERGPHTRHLCNVRACVNRAHVVPGTAMENQADRRKRRPWTDAELRHICTSNETQAALAALYGVNPSTIGRIQKRLAESPLRRE